jgi:hypothetical protein
MANLNPLLQIINSLSSQFSTSYIHVLLYKKIKLTDILIRKKPSHLKKYSSDSKWHKKGTKIEI